MENGQEKSTPAKRTGKKRGFGPWIARLVLGFTIMALVAVVASWSLWFFRRAPLGDLLPGSTVGHMHVDDSAALLAQAIDSRIIPRVLGGLGMADAWLASQEVLELLDNMPPWARELASIPLDFVVDGSGSFLVLGDLGWRATVLQWLPWLGGTLGLEDYTLGTTLISGWRTLSFAPVSDPSSVWYITVYRGIFLASPSASLMEAAMEAHRDPATRLEWSSQDDARALSIDPILQASVALDPWLEPVRGQSVLTDLMLSFLPPKTRGTLGLALGDDSLEVAATASLDAENTQGKPLMDLLVYRTTPTLFARLPEQTSMATGVQIASWQGLYQALPALAGIEVPSLDDLDRTLGLALGMDTRRLVFDWLGEEALAALVGNQDDPVLALGVKNESALSAMLNKLDSSLFVNVDTEARINGVEIQRIRLPDLLTRLIKLFGVDVRLPYLARLPGLLLVSESPWTLREWVESRDRTLATSDAALVASIKERPGQVRMYFNHRLYRPRLVRNLPVIGPILGTYGRGYASLSLGRSSLDFHVKVEGSSEARAQTLAGFPRPLEIRPLSRILGQDDRLILADLQGGRNPELLYPSEDGRIVLTNLDGTVLATWEQGGKPKLAAFPGRQRFLALSEDGFLSVYDSRTPERVPEVAPSTLRPHGVLETFGSGILAWDDQAQALVMIDEDGNQTAWVENLPNLVTQAPVAKGNGWLVFPRNLEGHFYQVNPGSDPLIIRTYYGQGLPAGGPLVLGKNGPVAWVAQNGAALRWDDPESDSPTLNLPGGTPVEIPATTLGSTLVWLDQEGTLHLLGRDETRPKNRTFGELRGKDTWLRTWGSPDEGLVAVGNGSLVWVFREDLSLVPGYPLNGGPAWFFDVDADGWPEVFGVDRQGRIHGHQLPRKGN